MDIIEESSRIIQEKGFGAFVHRAVRRAGKDLLAVITWAGDELDPGTRFRMRDLKRGLEPALGPTPGLSDENIWRIIRAYRAAKQDQISQPSPYHVTGDWALIVSNHHRSLVGSLESEDAGALRQILDNFARDPISLGLHLSGTLPRTFMARVYLLKAANQSYQLWKRMMDLPDSELAYEKSIGNMHGMDYNGKSIMIPSFNQSYLARRIADLLTGEPHRTMVVEIGGGYGSLPYHLFRDPRFTGRYCNLDIPEMGVIASYFLMSHFPEKRFLLYGEGNPFAHEGGPADIIIHPHFSLKDLPDLSCDLVFNSHGMSQMDPNTLQEYLSHIDRISTRYFLHANSELETASLTKDLYYVNLNRTEFVLPLERWLRIYRFPELIRNDGIINPEFSSWENLYERL